MTPEDLKHIASNYYKPGTREKRIQYQCIMWESMYRRKHGGMWPAMNRGQAGAVRAARLLTYMQRRK